MPEKNKVVEMNSDETWSIVNKAIIDHAKISQDKQELFEINLETRFKQIHDDLKEIKVAIKEGTNLKLEVMKLDNRIEKLELWQTEVKDKPKQNLDKTQKIVYIITAAYTLLTGGALLAILKLLQGLGGKP